MKSKLAAITMLLLSGNSSAAPTFDGVWTCQLQAKGSTSVVQNYISIHSKADGQAIFATLKESVNSDYFGYGLGTINGSTYAGYTKHAMPFSLTLGTDNILSGAMQGVSSLTNQPTDLTAKCIKVW